jgi:hypothetical protein
MQTRYWVAALVAGVIVAIAFAYASSIRAEFYKDIRESLKKAKAEGTLPPELTNVDVETMPLSDFGIELSREQRRRVSLADFILGGWSMWAPLVVLICFGVAYLMPSPAKLSPQTDGQRAE